MKPRILSLVIAIAILSTLGGCRKEPSAAEPVPSPEPGLVSLAEPAPSASPEQADPDFPPQFIVPLDADFLDDVIYLASGDRVETYANGTRDDFAACDAERIAVSGDVIAVWGGGVYREFTKDGAELLSYPMEETVDCMCVTEHYAVFAVPLNSGHRLVRMERKNGKTEEVPSTYQPYGDRFVVKSLAGRDKGDDFAVLVWSDAVNMNAKFGSFAASVDAKTGKYKLQYDFADDLASCVSLNAADPSDEAIYMLSDGAVPVGEAWYYTLYRYTGKTKDEAAYITATEDPAYPGKGFMTGFDRLTMRGRTACLFSAQAGAVWTETLPDMTKSLKILCDDLRADARMKALLIRLAKAYDTGVVIERLNYETYDQKVRVKLLAGDDDFDLYLINGQNGASLLGAILSNRAYEPLDQYPDLITRFEGMFPYAERFCRNEKADDELFGMPFGLAPSAGIIAVDPEAGNRLDLSGAADWTFDDFCRLAEDYAASWKEGDPFLCETTLLTDLMCEITQSLVNGTIARAEAEEMEKRLVRLTETGVIRDTNAVPIPEGKVLLICWEMIPPSGILREIDKYDRLPMPSVAGVSYIRGGGWILMNRASKNKDAAEKLLYTLTEETLLRDESFPTCSYVYPDYAKYNSTAKLAPSERLLEQYETHGTLLNHYEPYSYGFERLVQLLHIDGLWTSCYEGRSPEDFVAEVWKTMQAELFE